MPVETHTSEKHVFSIDDILGGFSGDTFLDNPLILDLDGSTVEPHVDKDHNTLFAVDSEFGFQVTDFVGAEQKALDEDYGEGFAGNILDGETLIGLALRDAKTNIFKSAFPFGTFAVGLAGTSVKASTEHYNVMAQLLSDQSFAGDPNAIGALDNDLLVRDQQLVGGTLEDGTLHNLYVKELVDSIELAIDRVDDPDAVFADLDFDRDGTLDTYRTTTATIDFDTDNDGSVETIQVAAVDLGNDGSVDLLDSWLNGFGTADITDIMEPNESTILNNIAYSEDYSVTLKDDGKLLYRFGNIVKRPNDIRAEVKLDLPDEWTIDLDENGIADSIEGGASGFRVSRAELIITHDITNNPNDQVRPEDYENEGATGRRPSYYVVTDPDDAGIELWVSPVDSYDANGNFLPSYFKLTDAGEIDLAAGGIEVRDPDGVLVGYRNEDDVGNPIGTVLRDESLIATNAAADLDFTSSDLDGGFTPAFFNSTDRDPFEWSYDQFSEDLFKDVFVGFESSEEAEAAGFTDDDLVSGPRWRLTANKFGQDIPGTEIPLIPNSQPPFQKDNIKYETGEFITTTLNLLDWAEDADGDGIVDDSPFLFSSGWMFVDPDRVDENRDGIIDEGWSAVNGTLNAGEAMPDEPILTAVTPNGSTLTHDAFDTSIYVKGDRQDSAKLFDIELLIEYESESDDDAVSLGSVQEVIGLTDEAQSVTFEGGAEFINPVVFASLVPLGGKHCVTTAIHEITSTGVTLSLEESLGHDGVHEIPEDLTLITFEEGSWSLEDGSRLEVGTVEVPAGELGSFISVEFTQEFEDVPVILVQIQTDNGGHWEIARVDNLSTSGFDVALFESEAQSDLWHMAEVVGWAAVDATDPLGLIDWGGTNAQAFNTGDIVDHEPTSFIFHESVGTDPLVSASIASFNGENPGVLRQVSMTDDGTNATIEFLVQEETSLDAEQFHVPETVTGLAFEESGLLTGFEFETDSLLFA